MMKNILLLVLFTWVSLTLAKTDVAPETMQDSESYRVEKAVPEKEMKREVAGGKQKKRSAPENAEIPKEDSDSEVRYWQYQE